MTQRLRRVPDRDLARFLESTVDPKMLKLPGVASAANRLLGAYWALARKAL